ncbi:MAG: hypothetical protein ACYDGN_00255 [Acidimicrobiales bacterium]
MRRLSLGVGLVLALSLAACGIPISQSPSRLPRSALPQVLVQVAAPARACHSRGVGFKTVHIYLVQAIPGDLVRVNRCVTLPPTVQKVLKVLEAGPFTTEYHNDLESALNINSNLQAIGPVGTCPGPLRPKAHCGLATVRLDRYFSGLRGEAPIQELGQIVWSLTQSDLGVTEVRFLGPNGGPVSVETATGRFVARPVTINDYRHLGTGTAG